MPRVIHFEIHVDDPERGGKFYQKVFGWKIAKWDGPQDYWLITTGEKDEPGIDGALMRRSPGATTVNTVDVPSVDEFAQKVVASGGKVVMPKSVVALPSSRSTTANSDASVGVWNPSRAVPRTCA